MTRLLPSRHILHRGVLIALGLLMVLLAVGSPDRASAQSGVLVSNLDETVFGGVLNADRAQAFTTGSNSAGYTLTSIDLNLSFSTGDKVPFTVAVHASSNGQPGSKLADLTAPGTLATGSNRFTHTGLLLEPATSYFVLVDATASSGDGEVRLTQSNEENGAQGWSIANGSSWRLWNSTGARVSTDTMSMRVNGFSGKVESLVSNLGGSISTVHFLLERDYAQQFTTGVNWTGYTLTSVDLDIFVSTVGATATFTVAVHADNNGQPGNRLATLTAPGTITTGTNTFTHAGLALAPATSYFLVIDVTSVGAKRWLRTTSSNSDSGAQGGSIANSSHRRAYTSTGAYTTHTLVPKMQVNGIVKPKPPVGGRDIFVANMSATINSTVALGTYDIIQEFRTGLHQDGYTLTSIYLDLEFTDRPRAEFTVSVHENTNGQPGAKLGTLDNPHWGNYWNGIYEWTHPGMKLDINTSYFVVIDSSSSGNGVIRITSQFRSGDANLDGEAGQILYNQYKRRGRASTGDYTLVNQRAIKLFIKGVIDEGPEDMILTVSPDRVDEDAGPTTLTFTANIGTPHPRNFYFNVDHSASLGEAYACSGRPSYDCLPVALSPRDYRGDDNWRGPTDYAVLGHYVGSMIPAGQTSVTWTETFIPYDDKVEEGEEYIYFIPEHGKFPPVRFTLANSEAAFSPDEPESDGPAELTGLTLAPVTGEPTRLAVSWDRVEGAARYDVRWNDGSGDSVEATANSYTITGLTPDTNYTVDVAAVGEDNSVLAEGTATGPYWIVSVAPAAGRTDALHVSWEAVEGAFHYFVRVNGGQAVEARSPRTSLQITGLEPDAEHTVALEAVSAMRDGFETLAEREVKGSTSAPQSREPGALLGLTVHPVGGETTRLAVSWQAVPDADKYVVKWKTGSESYSSGAETTSAHYTITGLTAGTTYTVQVTAVDTDADPDAELAVGEAGGATLAAMGAVTVAAVEGSSDILEVSWPAVPGAAGYVVEWKKTGGAYGSFARSETAATSGRLTALEAETAYTVRVTARHTIGGATADGDSAEGSGTTNAPPANAPASGAPAISGAAKVGETLTADTSGISDADGLDNATFSYQWLADGSDISGATGSSYAPVAADVGKAVSVRVSFTDDAGNAESLTSAATDAVVKAANAPASGAPAISGTARVGETLTADTSGIGDADGLTNAIFSYQWQADGSDISGATGSSYAPVAGDVGKAISVRVSFTDDAGNDETLTSAATAAVAAAANTPASGAPTISGTAQVGETLTADTSGIGDADGLDNASFAYQWLADGSDISGATSSTYTLAEGDAGKAISVRVSFTDDAGNDESLTSAATAAVAAAANTPASGAPTISGTAQVGETLTADTSGISDPDGLDNANFSYQWLADGSDISGATGSSYTPVTGDAGKAISVRVSFTDDAGNDETLTSAATAAVAAEDQQSDEADDSDEQSDTTPAAVIVIYYDPDAGDAAADRYSQAVKLLKDAGITYSEVKGDVQDDASSLAGVTDSVMPRFFLGDPTDEGWVSKPKENNGGLRWLKGKIAALSGD